MSDEKYRLDFNLGFALARFKNTNDTLDQMIQKAPERREALMAGRAEFREGLMKNQGGKMTAPLPPEMEEPWHRQQDRESRILKEYHDGMGPLPTPENDEKLIVTAERIGKGPELSEAQKKELSDFEASQRAKEITREARRNAFIQGKTDRNKGRDRER